MSKYGLLPPHDRLVDGLLALLHPHWIARERSRRPPSRHVLIRWIEEVDAFPERTAALQGYPETMSGPVSGELQEIIALAIDVHILKQVDRLPIQLIRRLRDPTAFQGARYEIAVAATVV